MLRKVALMAMALVGAVLAGCSSADSLGVEFSFPQSHEGALPFTVSGVAVDEETVCPGGTLEYMRLESTDGAAITEDDWASTFDAALADGTVAEMMVYQTWTCSDGTGTFTVEWHNRFDFATFEFEGRQDVGTWEINEGTGSYTGLTGSGDATLDWDQEMAILSGEVSQT